MRVAVTGGSGQLGSLILRRLLDDRTIKRVICLDRRPPMLALGKLEYVPADVTQDGWVELLKGCDALIHLAFVVTRYMPREMLDEINIQGSQRVFESAVKAGIKRIVYASSVAAYGVLPGHPIPIVEETPRRRAERFPYSACKYEIEEFLDAFEKRFPDVTIARMRPAIFVGARIDHPHGQALKRRMLPDIGGSIVPTVWDEDVADAFILALKKNAHGAFDLAADEPLDASELAKRTGLRTVKIPQWLALGMGGLQSTLQGWGVAGGAADSSWLTEVAGAPLVASSEKAIRELGWKRKCNTNVDVIKRYMDTVSSGVSPRVAAFFKIIDLASKSRRPMPELSGIRASIHLNLTGQGGGDWTMRVKDGRMRIFTGMPRPPTGTLTMRTSFFLDLLAKRADLTTAQLTGKIRMEGDPVGDFLLGGMLTTFQRESEGNGVQARFARTFGSWVTRKEAA